MEELQERGELQMISMMEEQSDQLTGKNQNEIEQDYQEVIDTNILSLQQKNNATSKGQIKKIYLPKQYQKAKKTLTKLINSLMNQLKQQFIKHKGQFKLNSQQLINVKKSINQYIKLIKGSQFLPQNIPIISKQKNKEGLYAYVSESQRLFHYSVDGKSTLTNLQITQLQEKQKNLPDMATPIPFGDSVYFLDGSSFCLHKKVYIPCLNSYRVWPNGKVTKLNPSPKLQRMKCLVVKDLNYIYLIGGLVKQFKIMTTCCQRYSPHLNQFSALPKLNKNHLCPTGCILNDKIWLMSSQGIQFLDLKEEPNEKWRWKYLEIPFGAQFYSFQFVHPISDQQIAIFGGLKINQKITQLQIFNIKNHYINNCGQVLPQGICNQRTSGVCIIHNHLVVLSGIQAAVYPQLGVKSNMLQLVYIGGGNSSYLHTLISI